MSKFTPGPWEAKSFAGIINVWSTSHRKHDSSAVAYDCSEADARLIAAAPELLSALEIAAEMLCDMPLMDPRFVQIRAAIAKATGDAS